MSERTIKIAVPLAGPGASSHTWSMPDPLVSVADGTVLDFVLRQFETIPSDMDVEYILIVGSQLEEPIRQYMSERHPEKNVRYVVQTEMRGQSDALWQAREYLTGPMILAFSDTLIETDVSSLSHETADAVVWVKQMPDPRRFGVAELNSDGSVTRLVERPGEGSNNLVLTGFYYFRRGEQILAAVEEQMNRRITFHNEFFLTDALNILFDKGARIAAKPVDTWLHIGTPEALLETNRHLLGRGFSKSGADAAREGLTIIPPVYIHESARIESAVIGPYVSVGSDCQVKHAILSNCILEEGAQVEDITLQNALIGRSWQISGQPDHLNIGDKQWTTSS